MPEGPEVRIMADGLENCLRYTNIKNIRVTPASKYHRLGLKNLPRLQYPLYVYKVTSKGKKIIIDCGDVTLVSALGMEGKWRKEGGKHAGLIIEYDYDGDDRCLYFHDSRHFGNFDICMNDTEFNHTMKDVGPDLLSDDVSLSEYRNKILQKNLKNKEVCWFMMEQKYFSGIGNYLMAEILYECRIMPNRLIKDLSDDDIENMWDASIRIIRESYKYGGLTISTYSDIDGNSGVYDHKVYGKKYDPYGNPVKTSTFSNGRTSHYVPALQV